MLCIGPCLPYLEAGSPPEPERFGPMHGFPRNSSLEMASDKRRTGQSRRCNSPWPIRIRYSGVRKKARSSTSRAFGKAP
jgi:hypothetical protein